MNKRLLAIFMTMVMCLSMSAHAFAAENVDNAVKDSVTSSEETVDVEDLQFIDIPSASAGGGTAGINSGVETWDFTGYMGYYAGGFTMEGHNLTPVKTIATNSYNQYLVISTNFSQCSAASKIRVQIKEYPSGNILAQNTSSVGTSGSVTVAAGPGMSGKKVQIDTRIYDANGNYIDSRTCRIDYWYTLRADGEGGDW